MAGSSRKGAFDTPFFRRDRGWNLWDDPWESDYRVPSRLFDQHFAQDLSDDDLLPPTLYRGGYVRPRRTQDIPQQSGVSEVINDHKEFRANLDVKHFRPEEITVKAVDTRVTITGTHEERQDEHGFIQRQFKRTYVLPKDVDVTTVKCTLTDDGILSLIGPKLALTDSKERTIPVEQVPTISGISRATSRASSVSSK